MSQTHFLKNIYLFIFWLRWVSVAAQTFSRCAVQGLLSSFGARASHCGGLSCSRAQALGCVGLVAVARGVSCSVACGLFLDQGSHPCPLPWQVDS